MIDHVTGCLDRVEDGSLILSIGDVGLHVLASDWTCQNLQSKIGQRVKLFTVSYLQSSGVNLFQPVLIGFEHEHERGFYRLMTTVDRMGPRVVLRMLTKPVEQIARAIEAGDAAFLRQLPGIGRQKALEIIAKLRGKAGEFITGPGEPVTAGEIASSGVDQDDGVAMEVLAVLEQLGYSRREARRMLLQARKRFAGVDAETLIREIFAGARSSPHEGVVE